MSPFRRSLLNSSSIFLIISIVFLTTTFDADARRYNKERTRQKALKIIQSTSYEISELAGLEPMVSDSANSEILEHLKNDSEILSDEIEGEYCLSEEEDMSVETYREVTVDLDTFKDQWLSYVASGEDEEYMEVGIRKKEVMDVIMKWLGTPYRYGGTTNRAIDCSAFMQKIFLETSDIMIPRTAREQIHIGREVSIEELKFGDLIFFNTTRRHYVSHVGIYLGDNLFAHAGSRYGVSIASLESDYYSRRFIKAKRLHGNDMVKFSVMKEDKQQAFAE